MANLFMKQGKQYSESRPGYPEELFHFIASKTTQHDLAWDVGTGSGQVAKSLAGIYKNVIATDTSQKQLEFAPKLPNIRYKHTPSTLSLNELDRTVSSPNTIDLVTVGQALHWFHLPTFYNQVKRVLKKPHGVLAAWCYTMPKVNDTVDSIFSQLYFVDARIYWHPGRNLVVEKYASIDFPFEPVDGVDNTGPFEFQTERVMRLDDYVNYIKSTSAYQTAREEGVELLSEGVLEDLKNGWSDDGNDEKVVKFPVYLRIGRVGVEF